MGCLAVCFLIAGWLGSGWLSWEIVNPYDFWSGLLFLFLWSVFGLVAQFIVAMIASVLD